MRHVDIMIENPKLDALGEVIDDHLKKHKITFESVERNAVTLFLVCLQEIPKPMRSKWLSDHVKCLIKSAIKNDLL